MNEKGFLVWLWGLSGSGKTTIGDLLEEKFIKIGKAVERLDYLEREGAPDSEFTLENRFNHIKRISSLIKYMIDQGIIVIASFITPLIEMREFLATEFGNNILLVKIQCPIEECIKRDVKGLYKKAIEGNLKYFTGISERFDENILDANVGKEIVVNTKMHAKIECVQQILTNLKEKI